MACFRECVREPSGSVKLRVLCLAEKLSLSRGTRHPGPLKPFIIKGKTNCRKLAPICMSSVGGRVLESLTADDY